MNRHEGILCRTGDQRGRSKRHTWDLDRETEIPDIMKGHILINKGTKQEDNIINKMGLTIEEVAPEEVEKVKIT